MSAEDQVRKTIGDWQDRLLQLDQRNRLLYFNPESPSVVELSLESIDRFLERLESARRGLAFSFQPAAPRQPAARFANQLAIDPSLQPRVVEPPVQPGDIETPVPVRQLQTRLLRLRNKDREFREEQGLNVLFLACGLLHWVDENDVRAIAPLVLVPCTLDRASPRDPFILRRNEDEAVSNITLEHKLRTDLHLDLPEFALDAPPEYYLSAVEEALKNKPDWRITTEVFLGIFQYSKMAMWEDLEELRNSDEISHPLVRFLSGDPDVTPNHGLKGDEWFLLNERDLAGGLLDDRVNPHDYPLVMPADFSQLQAIGAARTGQNLVIHGPPGTGKSQTIANLIGSFIFEGKSVLFVSEKTAALDVVKRRLTERGLDVFCLDLHSERGRKANVYAQLRESLAADRSLVADGFDYRELLDLRDRLNTYVREVHSRRALGLSVYQVNGLYAQVQELPHIDFAIPDPLSLTRESLAAALDLATRLAARDDQFREHFTSRWRPLKEIEPSVGIPSDIRRRVELLRQACSAVEACVQNITEWLGLARSRDIGSARKVEVILRIMRACPKIEPHWLDQDNARRLTELAAHQASLQEVRLDRLRAFEHIFQTYPSAIRSFTKIVDEAHETFLDTELPRKWLGDHWAYRVLAERLELLAAWRDLPELVRSIEGTSAELLSLLGLPSVSSRAGLQRIIEVCGQLSALATVPESWLREDSRRDNVLPLLTKAKELSEDLASTEATLSADFESQILQVVTRDMLVRFRLEYGSIFKRLVSGEYKRDVRQIRSHQTTRRKLGHTDLYSVVETAIDCSQRRSEWDSMVPGLGTHLGWRFKDRATDWNEAIDALHLTDALVNVVDPSGPGREALVDRDTLARVVTLSQELDVQLRRLDLIETTVLKESAQSVLENVPDFVSLHTDLNPGFIKLTNILEALNAEFRIAPESWLQLKEALDAGQAVVDLDNSQEAERHTLAEAFGRRFDGWHTDWVDVQAALAWTSQLLALLPGTEDSRVLHEHVTSPRPANEYEAQRIPLSRELESFNSSCLTMEELFEIDRLPWPSWDVVPFDQFRDWALDLEAHADSAIDWLSYQGLVRGVDDMTAPGTVDRIRTLTAEAEEIPLIIKRRLLGAWLDAMTRGVPILRQFSGLDHNDVIARFTALDRALPVAAQKAIRRQAFSGYPARVALTNAGELGVLRNELSKRRRQIPVRRLIQRIPALVKQLKPCFMMSPLAVSQFLPRTTDRDFFDVVIFDEASQVFPEDAVPSISRATQAIVVGDAKQLPPTSFFRRLGEDAETTEEQDEYEEEDALQGRDSILEAMLGKALGTIAIETHLNVHYRSRHENLIRFSNRSFYDGRLHVYPSAVRQESGLGLRDEMVVDAVYQDRRNPAEAQRVTDIVFELMRTRPTDETIGVVALSRTQADLIQETINNRRLSETDVESRFAESGPEPFFIKNLENVQGDERDHIVLCIGYGPNASGQVYQRFGPINSELGWRRLNVAVSRARRSLTVVHSLRPEQVTSATSGAKWLRSFLDFVKAPDSWIDGSTAQTFDAGEAESDFEAAVYSALSKRGHKLHRQVGAAGFRVDLAILSADETRYELGIECDGAAYHSGPAARDRDWLRQSILEGLGWCIYRVWSTDWIRNPMREVEAIESALARCQARQSLTPPTVPVPVPPEKEAPDVGPYDDLDLGESEPMFPEYGSVDLAGLRHGPDLRYETEQNLGALLLRLAEVEGPVHLDQALDCLRQLYGFGRSSQQMRGHVVDIARRLAKEGKLSFNDSFIDVRGRAARPRRPNADFRRPIDHIASQELQGGLALVSSVILGATTEELITETARQFGYERTGSDIQGALDSVLGALLEQGALIRDDDGIIRPSGDLLADRAIPDPPSGASPGSRTAVEAARSRGLEVIDKTDSGGALWVVGGPEFKQLLQPFGFKFADRGGRATGGRAAWWAK